MGLEKFLSDFIYLQLVKACLNFDEFCRVWILSDDIELKRKVYSKLSEQEKEKYKDWFIEANRIYVEYGEF
jgi:hypothetical protein